MVRPVLKFKRKRTQLDSAHAPGESLVRHVLVFGGKGGRKIDLSHIIQSLRRGLPVKDVAMLSKSLEIPADALAPRLGMSRATLHRRKREGRLSPGESDRVLRFARLMGRATTVLGGENQARHWLRSSQFGLGGAVPLDFADTEIGAREVEDLLGRIEHGVYS